MDMKHSTIRCLPVAAAAVALCLGVVGLRGQETASPQARAMALTWKLIADAAGSREDPSGLALEAFDMPVEQADRVRALGRQQAEEKARLLRELSRNYAGKVHDALDDAQRMRYDAALAALNELADAEAAARAAFVEAAVLTPEQADALPADYVPTSDLLRYLDVDDAARARVAELQAESDAAQERALLEGLDTSKWQDVETWRKHREQYAQAQQQAREQYEQRLAEALPADQVRKLKALETAAEQYRQALQDARRGAHEKIYPALLPSAPAQAGAPPAATAQ
jgi:hypothetical protein